MGALTENRKRLNDVFSVSCIFPSYSSGFDSAVEAPPLKKSRNSSMPHDLGKPTSDKTSTSMMSKIKRLPPPPPLPRAVHAPQRSSKFFNTVCPVRKSETQDFRTPRGGLVQVQETRVDAVGSRVAVAGYNTKSSGPINAIAEDLGIEEYKRLVESRENLEYKRLAKGRESNPVVSEVPGTEVCLQELKVLDSSLGPSSSPAVLYAPVLTLNDDTRKMVDCVLVNFAVARTPIYKELFESANRRDANLNSLSFEVQLAEQKISSFKLKDRVVEVKKDAAYEPFVPLTEDEEEEVSVALSGFNRRQCLVSHQNSNIEITRELLQCLCPGGWLNDEVINLYLELLKERERRNPKKFLTCHYFNTFFYKKLISGRNGYDYKAVRRWTTQKKIGYGLIECDKIFVPIHKDIHWCLAIISVKDEKFQYLDSLGGMDLKVLKVLARYFVNEVKDKSNRDVNVNSWKQEFVDDLPEQTNGFDCGMFMIKYADFYSRGLSLCFSQDDMPYFRKRTALEILRLKAE